jgi:hypothetical protein
LGEVLRDSLTSGGVLILVEDVAELLLCAVDAGEEDDAPFLLFDTVSWSGLSSFVGWAKSGLRRGLLRSR